MQCFSVPPRTRHVTGGQTYLSSRASPAVLLCQSDQGVPVIPGSLAGLGDRPSLGAPAALELLPSPWESASWRCSKPSSLEERTGTGHRAPGDSEQQAAGVESKTAFPQRDVRARNTQVDLLSGRLCPRPHIAPHSDLPEAQI